MSAYASASSTSRGDYVDSDGMVSFLGVPLHSLTMEQTVSKVGAAIRCRQPAQHVAMNVAKFVKLRSDAELNADVRTADIVSVDGMGILLGARLLGIHIPERVAGVDLMDNILKMCAAEGFRPYLLGATKPVLQEAVTKLAKRHPDLQLAGYHHGYFTKAEEASVVADILSSGTDCLFVGMPTPRKERFMAAHRAEMNVPFVMGVGGGLDILAEHVRRAPLAWQRSGFEWLYRVVQEPRRMWKRYLTTNMRFLGILTFALMAEAKLRFDSGVRRVGM
jgi:N-acetylglucosaminyldiphosphoundecaprenol N-acetyl-beta-D-mannosaminyltransferase